MNKDFFIKNKKKIIIGVIVLAISLIGISLINSTYSLFYHEDTASNTDAYSTGLLSIIASSKGENISLSNALPMSDSEGEATTPYTFTIKNIGNLDYEFNVKLLSTGDSSTTIDSRYIKVKVDDGSPATLSSLTSSIIKSDVTLAAGESIDISIRVWLSNDTPNTQIGKVFNSKIVTDGQAVYTSSNNKVDPALATLTHLKGLNSTITLASGTPDFTTVSGNNGVKYVNYKQSATGLGDGTKGIYATQDDLGTSYYFRGAVDNNYVKFAGLYWRIIRINGDGSIRMIYAGTSAHANGESETDSYISKTTYNSSYNDNTYVGYMTGSTGATTYASAHSNTNNSTIKGVIDTWYKTNIVDKGYSSYVADTIYCNDRSIANDSATNATLTKISSSWTNTGLGYGTNETAYGGFKRNWVDHTPSLVCPNNNDKFTTDSALGNGKLTYPVALITSDEIAYAGGLAYDYNTSSYIRNTDFYLYTPSYYYWTLTPWAFAGGGSSVGGWFATGYLGLDFVDNSYSAARAAVSLLSDAITGGNGTMNDPFTVG